MEVLNDTTGIRKEYDGVAVWELETDAWLVGVDDEWRIACGSGSVDELIESARHCRLPSGKENIE